MAKRKLTAAEKVERDRELVKDRARGMSWKAISEKHDIAQQNAHKIWNEWRDKEMPTLQGQDAIDVVFEILSRYEVWQGDLAQITANAKTDGSKISAIRGQMDCENRRVELMQATGLLPKHLGKLAVEFDVRYVVGRVLAIFDEYKLPPEAQRELLDVLQRTN